jgi:FAD:protein FMN transferase
MSEERRTARIAITAAAILSACLLALLLPGLLPEDLRVFDLTGKVMKTDLLAKVVYPRRFAGRAESSLQLALKSARHVEGLMSRFLPGSDISRLAAASAGTPVQIDAQTLRVLKLSKAIHRRSGGAFDVTVGPLVKLYKYTGRKEKRLPTDAEIAEALRLVGSDKLLLDDEALTARLKLQGMTVDLSAVAKGFSVDVALEVLRESGARAALVEIGGEVRAFGRKPGGESWRVGIQHPRTGRRMAALELDDRAVATSGDYQKFFKKGGRRASHIIDPRTGRPLIGGAVSVTVLAPSCALADGLATALSVLGPRDGLKLVEDYCREGTSVEALIIEETADGKLVPHASPGLKDLKLDL